MKLLRLFWEFFKISLLVVGGGYAIIVVADEVFGRKRRMLAEGEVLEHLPIFQMVPGLIAGNTAIYVGLKIAGRTGAAVALLGAALPSFLIFLAVSCGYSFLPVENSYVAGALMGLRAALTGDGYIETRSLGVARLSPELTMPIELVEAKNRAESMCFELEKLLKEHDDKLRPEDKSALNAAIEKTREACKTDDAEKIKSAFSELEQASHAMSKAMYENAQKAQAGAAGATGDAGNASATPNADDDAIDADFEVK